jgi:hypothetical protein
MQRLVVVYNRHSSKYARVKSEVLDRLPTDTVHYQIDNTKQVDANAAALAKFLQPGDRIISAGGDGTATVCVNAIIASKHDGITLGVLPYGNFNDMARTFGRLRLRHLVGPEVRTTPAYALDLIADGHHVRYGMCYFTVGMFAESTRIFDRDTVRTAISTHRHSRPHAIKHLAAWYLQHRHDQFLPPEFRLGGRKQSYLTDYVAVNATSMAGVMRNRKPYYRGKTFLSETGNLGHWSGLLGVMIPSVAWQIPGRASRGDVLKFPQPATVEVQAEGEYFTLRDLHVLEVRKSARAINMITRR